MAEPTQAELIGEMAHAIQALSGSNVELAVVTEGVGVKLDGRQRAIFWAILSVAGVILVSVVVIAAFTYRTTHDTNNAVRGQVLVLQDQHDADQKTIADLKSVVDQAVAAIIEDAQVITDLGGTPPQHVIKPPDDESSSP